MVYLLPEKWLPVSIAPFDTDLEVGAMDKGSVHVLIFPVRKTELIGWMLQRKNAST